jgi:hypothetical protein
MTVITWVNTWLTKDGQSDIVTNEISQDEQDGWVHLDVNPRVTVLEDDSINPLDHSVINVVSLEDQGLSSSNEPVLKEEANSAALNYEVKLSAGDNQISDTILATGDKENVAGDQGCDAMGSASERKMSRQERRYAERKTKKQIIRNVKAASTLQRTKPQQNCVSVARSVSVI